MFLYSDVFYSDDATSCGAQKPAKKLFNGNSHSAEDFWAPAGLQMFLYSDVLLFRWAKSQVMRWSWAILPRKRILGNCRPPNVF